MKATTDTVVEMLQTLDRGNVEGYVNYFAEDAKFRFGNYEPVFGRKQIAATCKSVLETIAGLRHDVLARWDVGDVTVLKLDITYHRLDGRHVTVPVAVIFTKARDLIADYQIYADIAPVFAESV